MADRWHPGNCKVCGRRSTEAEPISAQGYCIEHGIARMNENNLQLAAGSGPFYDHYIRRWYLAAKRAAIEAGQLSTQEANR